jgi:hypothetical protein
VTQELRIETGKQAGSIEAVYLGERAVYRNPFPGSGLPEDETALAVLLDGMEEYIRNGTERYPLADALQDAYLAILMEEALKIPGTVVQSQPQIWNKGQA